MPAKTSAKTSKDERLAIRLTAEEKAIITAASAVSGRSVTDFAITTLVVQAEELLADQHHFRVSAEDWNQIEALLNEPVVPNLGLAELFETSSVFATR
jgi:uncharacterized protein (DUF1778 family)